MEPLFKGARRNLAVKQNEILPAGTAEAGVEVIDTGMRTGNGVARLQDLRSHSFGTARRVGFPAGFGVIIHRGRITE